LGEPLIGAHGILLVERTLAQRMLRTSCQSIVGRNSLTSREGLRPAYKAAIVSASCS
jgi:hypothetical protein